ncbi:hypothetical protein EAO75_09310 [Streptomyces sp. uw30]|uniref:hypothetical protein n=1 Tax=Streptomyces sp. uw30 TaxID=1828179 RepID=UPI0011CE2E39|nr:hypothetical protein [Streptomyces sp. uw30]TXS51948.1 hypothetical protein EAO75_09310 [Streptomyces sp. uw30]
MINAAEAAMYQSAEDDAERRRIEAKLYAPPMAKRRPRGPRPPREQPQRGQMPVSDARSMMAQLAAQGAQLGLG